MFKVCICGCVSVCVCVCTRLIEGRIRLYLVLLFPCFIQLNPYITFAELIKAPLLIK
jgi:hypothetical protein